GMVLAAFLFMRRMAEVSSVQAINREVLEQDQLSEETRERWRGLVPRGVEVYDVNGPFFFGAAESFSEILGQVSGRPKAIIIDLEGVPAMDSTGLRALTALVQRRTRENVPVFLVGLQEQPRALILRSSVADLVGRDRLDLSPETVIELIRNAGLVTISRETAVPDGQTGGREDGPKGGP
ncbi:MAG TPA: STAS domain-containing protein, partial [Gemmatimonadales bacterium]